MDKVENERCPMCMEKKLTLIEDESDIPHFGKLFLFSMECKGCGFNKSDVECAEEKEPIRITFTVQNKKDLDVRLVKSSEASIKIPQLKLSMDPGPDAIGFVSNIEGLIQKFKKTLEDERDLAEDDDAKKTAKNLLKKLWNVECGDLELKIVIEDPSGNSAIVSDKAVKEPLKGKKK